MRTPQNGRSTKKQDANYQPRLPIETFDGFWQQSHVAYTLKHYANCFTFSKLLCSSRSDERPGSKNERAAIREHLGHTASTVTSATSVPPNIGHDGKPLPPGTFRAVFV